MRKKIQMMTFFVMIIAMSFQTIFAGINLGRSESLLEVNNSDRNGLSLYYQFDAVESLTIETDEGTFTEIFINGLAHTNIVGEPKLPMSRRLIAVPSGADVEVFVKNFHSNKYLLSGYDINHPIIPAQHPVPKCPDANPEPFEYNLELYQNDRFSNLPLAEMEEVGYLRGVRIFAINLYPVHYNPVKETIEVYNDIELDIYFDNANFAETEYLRKATYSPYFEAIYQSNLLNYERISLRDDLTRYPIKYIIISDPMFSDTLQPFIEWKTMKGYETIVGYTGSPEVGSTTTSIKNYLQGLWDSATPDDPAPSFVLFVGDTAQVPPFNGSTGNHITDLNYVRLQGNDFLPEIFYGRFSANNIAELQPQIDKTLEYEKFLMQDPSYLGEAVLIAGVDNNWASSHGNGHINYGTAHYFNASNGITAHDYLYPQSGSSSAAIINNVSNGVGYVNYTAHGSPTSWAEPSFTIPNIYSLQNEGKYPFVVGNCCITNQFSVYQCFGEAWLRAPEKGAIGYIGGTDNTYWDEDFWWGVGHVANIPSTGNPLSYDETGPGMFDGLFHTHNEDFINWYTTGGAMILSGNLAVEQSNSTRKNYYWEIYSLMGDPSLTPYMRVPWDNTAILPSQIFIGQSSIQIQAAPYSYVGLTMDGVIHGAGLIDETGILDLDITPFTTPGDASLVITLQNHEPVIQEIQVIPNEGSYVVIDDFVINLPNSFGDQPQYGDDVILDMSLENVGIEAAENVIAVLTSSDEYVTIIESIAGFGDIGPESSVMIEDAFYLIVADNIPDQHAVAFELEITGNNDETWVSTFNFAVNAPVITALYPIIDDSGTGGNNNESLDPGESVSLLFPVNNSGNAISPSVSVRITSGSSFIELTSEEFVSLGTIGAGAETFATFNVNVDPDVPEGSSITIGVNVLTDGYSNQQTFVLPVGMVVEDFASGDFESFQWEFSGNAPWTIDSSQSHSGEYSARSGSINNNQSSSMILSMDVPVSGEISFHVRVSSEANYDYLKFYVNNQVQGEWSGTVDWTEVSYPVNQGVNTFRWTYNKDYSVSHGSDCGWVDNIVFPMTGTATSGPLFAVNPLELDFGNVSIGAAAEEEFTISNFGNETLSGIISLYEGFELTGFDAARIGSGAKRRTALERTRQDHPYTIPPESYQTFTILFMPTEVSDYSGEINITTNDTNHPNDAIAINAWGILGLPVPQNLMAEVTENSVYLSWTAPDLFDLRTNRDFEFIGYNVYRDEQLITSTPLVSEEFTDSNLLQNSYTYYVTALYTEGESLPSNNVEVQILSLDDDHPPILKTALRRNYPNPFNPETSIEFALQKEQHVKLEVYNIAGQLVKILLDDVLPAGEHSTVWNSGSSNHGVSSGMYFYRMTTKDYTATRKMILLK